MPVTGEIISRANVQLIMWRSWAAPENELRGLRRVRNKNRHKQECTISRDRYGMNSRKRMGTRTIRTKTMRENQATYLQSLGVVITSALVFVASFFASYAMFKECWLLFCDCAFGTNYGWLFKGKVGAFCGEWLPIVLNGCLPLGQPAFPLRIFRRHLLGSSIWEKWSISFTQWSWEMQWTL